MTCLLRSTILISSNNFLRGSRTRVYNSRGLTQLLFLEKFCMWVFPLNVFFALYKLDTEVKLNMRFAMVLLIDGFDIYIYIYFFILEFSVQFFVLIVPGFL